MMDVRTDSDDVAGEAENLLLLHKCRARAVQSRGGRCWVLVCKSGILMIARLPD